ncbi:Heterokaryon incompatibility protein 6 like [Verticillium longisporum]|uniref:Heterokaryon incompatibility protein 6 like n=1 Tax=Verticillium longisporum TaxID=100787 RepID=A0A8I3APM4_VERLO|nr:Heterokaryon incompatibility protein 6 like [Verticillium longisporum]
MSLEHMIKILVLHPHHGKPESPIECVATSVLLSESPVYEALSYVWGTQTTLTNVFVSGAPVAVTQNLETALRKPRLPDRDRCLWIDQLCIDQDDPKEKAIQVRLMRTIYSKCTRCIVWLGEIPHPLSHEDADAAIDIIRYMAAVYEAGTEEGVHYPPTLLAKPRFNEAVQYLRFFTRQDNAWWTRVWTLQEVALPPSVDLLWGSICVSWDVILKAKNLAVTKGLAAAFPPVDDMLPLHYFVTNVAWVDGARQRLDGPFNTVHKWRWRGATDKRDKIYGLLGLIDPGILPITEACDYEVPASEVFAVATLELVIAERSLRPMVACSRVEAQNATPDIPRWAFDLGNVPMYNTNWGPVHCFPVYNACGGAKVNIDEIKSLAARRSRILEIGGWYVDTVDLVGDKILIDEHKHGHDNPVIREKVRQWKTVAESSSAFQEASFKAAEGNSSKLDETFARVLLGDWVRDHDQTALRGATLPDVEDALRFCNTGELSMDMRNTILRLAANQVFFVTKKGYMGMGTLDSQPGDEVWVLEGGNYPFILKPKPEPTEKDFVGSGYVQGVMKGELFSHDDQSELKQRLCIC